MQDWQAMFALFSGAFTGFWALYTITVGKRWQFYLDKEKRLQLDRAYPRSFIKCCGLAKPSKCCPDHPASPESAEDDNIYDSDGRIRWVVPEKAACCLPCRAKSNSAVAKKKSSPSPSLGTISYTEC